jgi:hypothetical protein
MSWPKTGQMATHDIFSSEPAHGIEHSGVPAGVNALAESKRPQKRLLHFLKVRYQGSNIRDQRAGNIDS